MNIERFMNRFLMDLKPYKSISQEVWEKAPETWDKVLKLDWNEATVEPSPRVREKLEEFWKTHDLLHLYPNTSNKELISAISQFANVPEGNVQYFSSSDSLHEYIGKCYIQSGDKVLILWPSYDNFRSTAEANGAQIIYSEMNDGFELDITRLTSDIRYYQPKIVYICNPNNPTGHCIPKSSIRELVSEFKDTLFLIDEAYTEFTHQSVNDLVVTFDNLLVTHTMSKAFGLANIRFGYLVADIDHIDIISRIRNPKNITTYAQVAALAALEDPEYMWRYVDEVNSAREWFYNALKDSEYFKDFVVYPSKSNFILIKCPSVDIKAHIYYSLRERNIYVRQLSQTATLLNCIRITIGTRSQMEYVFDVLKGIMSGITA